MSDDDVTVLPLLPSNMFLVVSMISFSYTDKLYIKMIRFQKKLIDTITTSNFYLKFKENNENDMAAQVF